MMNVNETPKNIPDNVRVLQAFCSLCIKRYCEHFGINHPEITRLITHLFGVLEADYLPEWERRGASLTITGRGDSWPDIIKKVIPLENVDELDDLIQSCIEVGLVDLYGASTNEPKKIAGRCANVLSERGISIPEIDFLVDRYPGEGHWGNPVDQITYNQLTKHFSIVGEVGC